MSTYSRRALYWAPRALTIAFIAFLSLFALDVFQEGRGFWETLAALLMHLTPSFFLVAFLLIAWRREWLGAMLFAGAGIFLFVVARPTLAVKILIAGPAFLAAVLFLLNWLKRAELRART